MALDRIRRELAAELDRQAAAARRNEEERLRQKRENTRLTRPALQCLQELESRFWSCSEAFATLCGSRIDSSSRSRQGLWSRLLRRSCATDEQPRLHVTYEPLSPEMGNYHTVKLEARQGLLYFEAAYGLKAVEAGGVQGSRYSHVIHRDTHPVIGFSAGGGKMWLESQFERYLRDLTGWKEQFPELWNPRRPESA